MQRQSSNTTQRSRTQQKQHGSFQSWDDDTCSCSLAAEGYTGPRRVDHPNSYDTIDTLELRESAAKNFLAALTISRPPAGRHALRSDAGPYEQAEELGCLATSSSGRHGLLLSLASSGLRFWFFRRHSVFTLFAKSFSLTSLASTTGSETSLYYLIWASIYIFMM